MQIKVDTSGLESLSRQMQGMQKQVAFATAVALTRTAKAAQGDVAAEFARKFDRPTPTVMNGLWTKPATKQNLRSMVYVKDRPLGGKNPNSLAQILAHEFSGGSRIAKQLEVLLRQQGFLTANEYVAPGGAAKLDRYGNMSRGQITQILSQIGVIRAGFDSTATGSKRSRRNVQRAGVIFWSAGPNGGGGKPLTDAATGIVYGHTGRGGRAQHLPKGAWVRSGDGVKPLLIVIRAPHYSRRIDMAAIVRKTIDRVFQTEFDRAYADAIRTAR